MEIDSPADAADHSSDDFSLGCAGEDGDGMFDMFTGGVKSADDEAGASEPFEIVDHGAEQSERYVYGSLKGWNNIRVLDIEPKEDLRNP